MQRASTATPFAVALALQTSLAAAFFAAASRRNDSHLLGPPSARSARTAVAQLSAMHSQRAWSPPPEPALGKPAAYFASTFCMHGPRSVGSPLTATLA